MRYVHMRFPDGKEKAVTFSYDDGCPEDIRLSDTLSSYGLKCTFNLTGREKSGEYALTDEQINEHFLSKGHEIAVHGAFHRAEGRVRTIEGIKDVLDCRVELENRFGIIVRGMAYPDTGIGRLNNGVSYEKIRNYLSELDIVYARTAGKDNDLFELPNDWYSWIPTAHHNNPELMDYIDKFLNIDLSKTYVDSRYPRLFYIWGHSFEFERNNNWKLLDEICEKLSNKDEIWYATNIEIYNYVEAYNSLIYSADAKIIYNPTLYTIWFDLDKTIYSIAPGETIKL